MDDLLAGDILRPENWDEFVGQTELKVRLQRNIDAALIELRPMEHMLICAKPGFGKTSLARIIARQAHVNFDIITMPVKFSVIVQKLAVENYTGVLLLDEIHRLSQRQQEDYLTLVESNYMEFHGEKIEVSWVTLIGATTEKKRLIKPLRGRFSDKPVIDEYSATDMQQIVSNMTKKVGVELQDADLRVLAGATGGVPRRARDFALAARTLQTLRLPLSAATILDHVRVDGDGLTIDHLRYLEALKLLGGEAGLRPLASYLDEMPAMVEELERELVEKNLITFTPRGRALKSAGYTKLKETP